MISSESPNYASACTQHNLCRELSSGGLANEWFGTMASRVRKRKLYYETNSTPQRPIEPHEICVKKITASMMLTYYEFLHYK